MQFFLVLISIYIVSGDVIYAVNCGGDEYVDSKGVL